MQFDLDLKVCFMALQYSNFLGELESSGLLDDAEPETAAAAATPQKQEPQNHQPQVQQPTAGTEAAEAADKDAAEPPQEQPDAGVSMKRLQYIVPVLPMSLYPLTFKQQCLY